MKWYNDMTEQQKRNFKKSNCCMCSRCNFNFAYSYDLEIHFISKYKFSDLYGRYVYEKKYSYLNSYNSINI